MTEKHPETETPTDIPSWMDWGNLREKTGEIAGRIIAIERQFSEFRTEVNQRFTELREEMNQRFTEVNQRFSELHEEMNQRFSEVNQRFSELREETNQRFSELREEMNQRFGEINRKQDRLLYLMLALAPGMVANLAYLSLTS